ncbi:MAG: hypothetical protein JO329_11305 [Planctomycetaceae bacterium]|nr:hypothetical protein [Planctomycetaceae bacterium]
MIAQSEGPIAGRSAERGEVLAAGFLPSMARPSSGGRLDRVQLRRDHGPNAVGGRLGGARALAEAFESPCTHGTPVTTAARGP